MSTAPGRCAAAVAHRRSLRVPISARRRRTSRAAARLIRAPAVRPAARSEDQPQMDRPLAPGRARVPSAMTRKTTDCAAAWARCGFGRLRRTASLRAVARGGLLVPWRRRSRRAGSALPAFSGGRLVAAEQETAVFRRPDRPSAALMPAPAHLPRELVATPEPSCRAIFFSSRTTIQRPSIIIPVQATIAPVRIRVLPKLNSLTGIPKPIATRPANRKPIPAINNTATIELPPGRAPKCAQAAYATIPSYCAHRQRTIAAAGSREGIQSGNFSIRQAIRACEDLGA